MSSVQRQLILDDLADWPEIWSGEEGDVSSFLSPQPLFPSEVLHQHTARAMSCHGDGTLPLTTAGAGESDSGESRSGWKVEES